jgi:hypothetical protein
MRKYLSGRHRKVQIGVNDYTNNTTVLDTIGRVGINTNITPSALNVVGNTYITGNLGIGVSIPTSAKITFGDSLTNVGILKGKSSLRLFDQTVDFTEYAVYGIGVNDDSFLGLGIGVTFLDISANSPEGGIRFFAGSYAFAPTEVVRITPQGFVGIGTDVPTERLTVQGSIKSYGSLNGSSFIINNPLEEFEIISQNRILQNISDFDEGISDLISQKVASNPKRFVNLNVLGITTFVNGPILVSAVEPSGTANQLLQVSGGIYAADHVAIGLTNPSEKLTVMGNISISDNAVYGTNDMMSLDTAEISLYAGLSTSLYRFVEFNIQASHQNDFHYTKILALQDGTNAYTTEYASVYNNNSLALYDVKIIDGNISLNATPSTSNLINYKVYFVATRITPSMI